MSEHTRDTLRYVRANPSPTTGEHLIAGQKPGYLAEVRDCGNGSVEANARRMVACWNACQGLATDDLESTGLVSAVGYQLIELKKQRDALLAALENAADSLERAEFFERAAEARAHIAAAKGGAA